MVTDGEKAIITAVRNKLPNINLMRCWNHIIRDIQSWLKQHGEKATDLSFYCNDVRQLFQATSETEYNKLLTKVKWDNLFKEYYMKSFHHNISSIGRWNLEECGIYNPYSGITNNYSESLNRYVRIRSYVATIAL